MTKNIFVPIANTFLYCFSIVTFHQKNMNGKRNSLWILFSCDEKRHTITNESDAWRTYDSWKMANALRTVSLKCCLHHYTYCMYLHTHSTYWKFHEAFSLCSFLLLVDHSLIQLVKIWIEKQDKKSDGMVLLVVMVVKTTFESILTSISQFLFWWWYHLEDKKEKK